LILKYFQPLLQSFISKVQKNYSERINRIAISWRSSLVLHTSFLNCRSERNDNAYSKK